MKNRRNKYNIRPVTTKKQWILVAAELVFLTAGPMCLLPFADNDLVIAAGLAVIFIVSVILCAVVVAEDRKRYREAVSDIERQRKYNQGVIDYYESLINTQYEAMDEPQKYFYLVFSLYLSSTLFAVGFFYRMTVGIPQEEIQKRLDRFPFSEELRTFLIGIVYAGKETLSVRRFAFELRENAYASYDREYPRDPTLGDKSYVYSMDRCRRYRVIPAKKGSSCSVLLEISQEGGGGWSAAGKQIAFKSKEKADAYIRSEFNKDNGVAASFFQIREYTERERRLDQALYDHRWKLLPEKFMKFMDYYTAVSEAGHASFFEKYNLEDYREALAEYLPKELTDRMYEAVPTKAEKSKIAACDAYAREHRELFIDIIDKFETDASSKKEEEMS